MYLMNFCPSLDGFGDVYHIFFGLIFLFMLKSLTKTLLLLILTVFRVYFKIRYLFTMV